MSTISYFILYIIVSSREWQTHVPLIADTAGQTTRREQSRSLNINPGDILIWTLEDHEIKIKPRKRMQFKDIVGLIEGGEIPYLQKREYSAVNE